MFIFGFLVGSAATAAGFYFYGKYKAPVAKEVAAIETAADAVKKAV